MPEPVDIARVHLVNANVLVEQLPPEEMSRGGIVLPDVSKTALAVGVIKKFRAGAELDGTPLQTGQLAITGLHAMIGGSTEKMFGDRMCIVKEADLLCIIDPEPT